MDDQEYRIAIERIVADGKGYMAIRDLSFLLEFDSLKTEHERDFYSDAIRLIRKIGDSDGTVASKLRDILSLAEPEDKKVKDRIEKNMFNSIRR